MKTSSKMLILAVSACVASSSHALIPDWLTGNYAKAAALAAAGLGGCFVKDQAKDLASDSSKLVNVHASDLVDMGLIALFCKSASYLFADGAKFKNEQIRVALGTLPLSIILGYIITTSKTYNKVFNNVPVVGDNFACQHEDCKGVCNKCKLKKLLQATLVGAGISSAAQKIGFEKIWSSITGSVSSIFAGNTSAAS